jgi:hypothetical protein
MEYAVITFVGPGEIEYRRLRDLIDSVLYFEQKITYLVIIDDNSCIKWDDFTLSFACPSTRFVILHNPRNGRGDWWKGGMCVGLATAFLWLAKNTMVDFAVRLDTDSLVIAPFSNRIKTYFSEHPQAGLIGTYMLYPDGNKTSRKDLEVHMRYVITKLSLPFSIWRKNNPKSIFGKDIKILSKLFKSHRIVANLASIAIKNKYIYGEFVQGGGYAISGKMIRKSYAMGFIELPLAYLNMDFSEDHLATLLSYATKHYPADYNQKGEVFGVRYVGLFTTPEELIRREYAIIHSVKSTKEGEEETIRDYFKSRRKPVLNNTDIT